MAETDTLERTTIIKLQVASLPPMEGSRGFARLPATAMKTLSLSEGDVIEIVGKQNGFRRR